MVDRNTPSEVVAKSKQMGTDIYANLVAAHNMYPDRKKIVLDFGTALTASCVAENGECLGGHHRSWNRNFIKFPDQSDRPASRN